MFKIFRVLILLISATAATATSAQDKVYRCGNEYTNIPKPLGSIKCTLITQANVTVVPAPKPPPVSAPAVRSDAQREKDAQARSILENELKKSLASQAELRKEFNNGEPEKTGSEARNYQKYLDRVAELKANLQRNDADIASLRREIARLPGAAVR